MQSVMREGGPVRERSRYKSAQRTRVCLPSQFRRRAIEEAFARPERQVAAAAAEIRPLLASGWLAKFGTESLCYFLVGNIIPLGIGLRHLVSASLAKNGLKAANIGNGRREFMPFEREGKSQPGQLFACAHVAERRQTI